MRIEIEFDTGGEAFFKHPLGEPSRLVYEVGTRIMLAEKQGRLTDISGNDVGTWAITDA